MPQVRGCVCVENASTLTPEANGDLLLLSQLPIFTCAQLCCNLPKCILYQSSAVQFMV